MRKLLVTLLVFSLSMISSSMGSTQSEIQLPTDLLFSVVTDEIPFLFNTLVKVDAESLEVLPFYTDVTSIHAVSWSPHGQFLSVVRDASDIMEICILNRVGELQTCFDSVSRYAFKNLRENFPVTWSDNEQHIYFITENERVLSLVEGDIFTGQVLRTIYQSQIYYEWPPLIHWSSVLDYVVIYSTNRPYTSDYEYESNISVRDVAIENLKTNETLNIETELSEDTYYYACEGLSPVGNYLVGRVYVNESLPDFNILASNLSGLVLVDMEGSIIPIISQAQLDQYSIDWGYCPTWQEGAEAFYFLGGSYNDALTAYDKTSIFKYTLSTGELIEYKELKRDSGSGFPVAPLILSPDGSSVALRFIDGGLMSEIAVLLGNDEITRFTEPYSQGIMPIWIPTLGS